MMTSGFWRRLAALVRKETRELLRDNSSLALGVVLPLVLILIIGYGMSLDVKNVPTAVVIEDSSPLARQAVSFTQGSEYFEPVFVSSLQEGEEMIRRHQVDAMLVVPPDFSARFAEGKGRLQVILNGTEATTAMSAQGYFEAGILSWAASEGAKRGLSSGGIEIVPRIWFNDANTSTWFYVPGILMLVLTISGVFLTSVVMAREWERGTFESLFVTPMKILELILAKTIPYFVIAMLGMLLCLIVGRELYDLPMRGSLVLIIGESMLYLIVALGIGLVISALTKNQFLACHVSLMISFLPSVVLSGFLFDLHAEPAAIRVVSSLIPTTYYLELMKSLFLSGNYWPLIARDTAILVLFALFFLGWAFRMTRKKVES
ncbi:ABC transporter permease [Mitsuokella sp.]|uniref:ABC transporter permease n=1 Tax=Mitsuokella sp. TaxID=2049034 RepID=UPI003D7E3BBF